jgi:hypothetical protein
VGAASVRFPITACVPSTDSTWNLVRVRVAYFLKVHERLTMVFDDTTATFDGNRFKKYDWSKFYPDAARPVPNDAPEPRGKAATL